MKRIIISLILAVFVLLAGAAYAEIMKCDDDIIAFFKTQTESEFKMSVTSDMYDRLTRDEWTVMKKLELRGGIATASVEGQLDNYGVFKFSETQRIQAPYDYAEDDEAFNKAAARFAEEGETKFSIVCMGKLYQQISAEQNNLSRLTLLSAIDTYQETITDNGAGIVCNFKDVTFTASPKLLCRSIDDMKTAMSNMGAAGITDYILVTDETVYAKICKNGFEAINEIERDAGIIERDLYYNATDCVLY